jgi:hypothetical protein
MYLLNALIAKNNGDDCFFLMKPLSYGNNLDSDTSCQLVDKLGDISGVDPLMSPLANHGGTTKTHRLLPRSPAIDSGFALTALSADQRGFKRPKGKGWDIGAVEFDGFSISAILMPLLLN